MKRVFLIGVISISSILIFSFNSSAQFKDTISLFSNAKQFTPWRFWTASTIQATAIPLAVKNFNSLKYLNNSNTGFYWRNDNKDWLQVDKVGQFWATYRLTQMSSTFYNWAGVPNNKAATLGAIIGFTTISSFEFFDGKKNGWGASPGDIGANSLAAALVFWQWRWEDPYAFNFKYSSSSTIFPKYNPKVLGENQTQRLFNDYNGQTFWASIKMNKLVPYHKIPDWLNLAIGYGAHGMIGNNFNPVFNESGEYLPEFERYRQYYLSVDIDIRRFESKIPFINAIFKNFGFIKIPAPTLEFSKFGAKFYPIYL